MPGMDHIYIQTLRTALGRTEFTKKVVERLGVRNEFTRRFSDSLASDATGDEPAVLWRSPEDHIRFDKYKEHSDLYHNDHEPHLLPEWLPSGKREYKRYNLCRFLTNTYTDLMLGGGAKIKTPSAIIDKLLNEELEVNESFDHWAKMASVKGMIGVQVVDDDRGVDLVLVRPEILYPEFDDGSDEDFKWIAKKFNIDPNEVQVPADVDWEFNKNRPEGEKDDGVVFEERHFKGRIEYYLYTVRGDLITEALNPQWYNNTLPALDEEGVSKVDTGIDDFMLQVVPNIIFDQRFISDFDDIVDIQRDLNARITQINRILNMHADPKLMLPESFMAKDPYTGEPIMRGVRDEVLFIASEDQDNKPEYLTWNSQIQEGFNEMESDINMFCTVTGISPSLIVRKDGQFPEAASTYKLRLTPTITKVKFKANFFKRYIRRALWVLIQKLQKEGDAEVPSRESMDARIDEDKSGQMQMSQMDQPTNTEEKTFFRPRDIELRFTPCLPQDDRFLVERVSTQPPTASLHRVLKDVDDMSDAEVQEEIKRISDDAKMQDEMNAGDVGFGGDFGGGGGFGGGPPEANDGGLGASPTGAQTAGITPNTL